VLKDNTIDLGAAGYGGVAWYRLGVVEVELLPGVHWRCMAMVVAGVLAAHEALWKVHGRTCIV